MEIIDYNQIANLVKNGDVNYVAFVTSPWHLIGAKATIQYIKQEGVDVKPVIISTPHPETGYAVTQDDEYTIYKLNDFIPPTPIIRYVSFLFWCWRIASKSDVRVYFANAWYGKFKRIFWILSSFNTNFKILIFEEGIGSYVNKYYTLKHYVRERNLLQLIQIWTDLKLSKHFTRTGNLISMTPLKCGDDGKFCFNETAITMYRKALGIMPMAMDASKVVVLTQEIDEEIYKVVNDVIKVLTSRGIDVYIKAHPRFPIDQRKIESKVTVVEHSVAIESVLQSIKTKYVIGFNTTALVSLRYLYDVTTISIMHLVNNDCCQGLFDSQRSFNKWLAKSFSDMVKFPNNAYELQKLFD